ncbi:unnamed protein product [Blepharisma stoltei]|uniref:NAC domain-containing protein n=1 Tax=Blepharisma stoltei TaxID=1481888 RepID=A0AAU9JEB0_9CILI|nr:unnamed protein product [Blepharisma stoltei]
MAKHNNPTTKFDWESKWLTGEEYSYILTNIDSYCAAYNMQRYPSRCHPISIYTKPQNGLIYFVKGSSVGSEFGFPRVDIKKRYRWKKMNFTTELPKRQPIVVYIVASAVKSEKYVPGNEKQTPSYRMHAVILKNANEDPYILCHIRKLNNTESPPSPETPIKKIKTKNNQIENNGLHELLNAANQLVPTIKSIPLCIAESGTKPMEFKDFETDYVSLFRNSSIDKFPALSVYFQPLFYIESDSDEYNSVE